MDHWYCKLHVFLISCSPSWTTTIWSSFFFFFCRPVFQALSSLFRCSSWAIRHEDTPVSHRRLPSLQDLFSFCPDLCSCWTWTCPVPSSPFQLLRASPAAVSAWSDWAWRVCSSQTTSSGEQMVVVWFISTMLQSRASLQGVRVLLCRSRLVWSSDSCQTLCCRSLGNNVGLQQLNLSGCSGFSASVLADMLKSCCRSVNASKKTHKA